jgi:hypothetical protein
MSLVIPGQGLLFELGDGMCQRWTGGRDSYRPSHPGGFFDPRGYEVKSLDDDTTPKEYIVAHHYSGSYPSALHRFGLYRDTALVGVAVYSTPGGGDQVLTCVFPELRPSVESVELGRLVLADDVAGNAETWFLARCHELLTARGVVGIISFSDPVPRRLPTGRLVMPGHVGIVYQAMNAIYTGTSTARTLWILPDGTVMSGVALQKIRQRKRGHRYAEQTLIRWGMRPMDDGEDPCGWLAEAKTACRVRTYRHAGNHQYVWLLGDDVHLVDTKGELIRRPSKRARTALRKAGRAGARRDVKIAKRVLDHTHYPKRVETRELVTA